MIICKKKKYNNKLAKQGLSKDNKKSNKNISDILDIQIKDCFIKVGNRYSSILRLGNIDYHMLSDDEQEVIENVLVQTALSIDYLLQDLVITICIGFTVYVFCHF